MLSLKSHGYPLMLGIGPIYQGAAGRTDMLVTAPKFATDSINCAGSMTKIVTVTCLMQLVEKGLLKLDEDVRPLVPELAKMQILRGFDKDDKPILEDNVMPITLRYVPYLDLVPLIVHVKEIRLDYNDCQLTMPPVTCSHIPSDSASTRPILI